MKYLFLAALFASMPLSARADVMVETTGLLNLSENSVSGQGFPEVELPTFNQSLGTLTGVTIGISAGVSETVTDYTGTPTSPSQVPASISLSFNSANPVIFGTQSLLVTSNGVTAHFGTTFSMQQSFSTFLSSYTTAGDNFFIPNVDAFVRSLAGPDTESVTDLTFEITEYLDYSPSAAVSEPAAVALYATGLGIFGLTLSMRRRRSVITSMAAV